MAHANMRRIQRKAHGDKMSEANYKAIGMLGIGVSGIFIRQDN
ncbi:hypothetical protein N478_25950 [Pseudoalteromonas luteoviolacea S4060-1]|uniref:Uncharacterized protein n=1 Tax=Pseudoalteromonas luteoviolacea S4060-1 TaxID=1365257 RepID=A0A167JB33_9GAMM|nr:hypothetical protein N478_25950 [Pseudoalteromonas luteoviolacea S4060-1]